MKGSKIVSRDGFIPGILDILPTNPDEWVWATALFTLGGKQHGARFSESFSYKDIPSSVTKAGHELDLGEVILCSVGNAFAKTARDAGHVGLYDRAREGRFFASKEIEDSLIAEIILQIGAVSVGADQARLMFRNAASSALRYFREGSIE